MEEMKQIEWTLTKFKRFKSALRQAEVAGEDSFIFDGDMFILGYAKYLIEYLETVFNKGNQ